MGPVKLRLAVVSGLGQRAAAHRSGFAAAKRSFDLIEVMACPWRLHQRRRPAGHKGPAGGCRPAPGGSTTTDKMLQVHSVSGKPLSAGSFIRKTLTVHKAHALFHTQYKNRKRITGEEIRPGKPARTRYFESRYLLRHELLYPRRTGPVHRHLMKYVRRTGASRT